MSQKLSVKQIQTVSQRVIQTNAVLQLTAAELEQYIQKEAEENPVLEVIEDEQYTGTFRREESADPEEFWHDPEAETETLREHLLGQITRDLTPRQRRILEYLLDSLDGHGYLRADPAETAQKLGVSLHTVQEMTELIQSLEPAGVGAKDLQECLVLQLERTGIRDEKLYRFIREGLTLLADGKVRQLRMLLQINDEEIAEYTAILRTLDPRPGSPYRPAERNIYIVPDIFVEEGETGWVIRFNGHLFHQVRVREEYRALTRAMKREEKTYVRERMRRVNFLQRSIQQREKMITSLAEYIVQRQMSFFTLGEGNLKSLRMQEAADDLGVHVSSISRAVNGKYLQCEWGIYPLKYFFTQGKGEGPVRTDIQKMIREIIQEEETPLSDSRIAEILKEKGIDTARRTVAKYREKAGIPDVNTRKRNR